MRRLLTSNQRRTTATVYPRQALGLMGKEEDTLSLLFAARLLLRYADIQENLLDAKDPLRIYSKQIVVRSSQVQT